MPSELIDHCVFAALALALAAFFSCNAFFSLPSLLSSDAAKFKEETGIESVGELEGFAEDAKDLKRMDVSEADATKLLERIEAVKRKLPS